jgi:hypothetical protein
LSKLGVHAIKATPEALDWARVAPAVKCLDDTTALRVAERASIRIFRHYFPEQHIDRPGHEVVNTVLAALGDAPATHIELFNECYQRLGQGLERYVEFTHEAVVRLRTVRPDLTLVAYCFSTGNPEKEDWEYLRAHRYGGAKCIGLHQYFSKNGFSLYNGLRHRLVHEWTEGDHPPFLITECGIDDV